jgi:hypothetical protein
LLLVRQGTGVGTGQTLEEGIVGAGLDLVPENVGEYFNRAAV